MKKHLVTVSVVCAILAGLVLVNRYEADRLTTKQKEQVSQAKLESEQANEAVENMRAKATEALKKGYEDMAKDAAAAEDPSSPDAMPEPAGDTFNIKLECSTGPVVLRVHPEWAPLGAARLKEMVEKGLLDEARFFRVVPGFIAQFGIPGDPKVASEWFDATIPDDPVRWNNKPGTLTFATSGPNSRTTQLFINLGDNSASLDNRGFAPVAEVIEGMENVRTITSEYRELPNQMTIRQQGNVYLEKEFPNLDYVKRAEVLR